MPQDPQGDAAERLLDALRARGVVAIRRVRLRANRVRLLSISRDRVTLNIHECFRDAGDEVLDAVAAFLLVDPRSAAYRSAVAQIRAYAVARAKQADAGSPFTANGGANGVRSVASSGSVRPRGQPKPAACCGTPEQRDFLRTLYRHLNRSRCDGRLPDALSLRFSRRMRRRLGHIRYHRTPEGDRVVVELALNIDLLLEGAEAQLIDTLLHEMAHVEAWLVHGHRGHGAPWKRIARRLGCEPRACTRAPVRRRPTGAAATRRIPVGLLPG